MKLSSCCCFYICRNINNGVYRAGFATSQEAYDVAVRDVFNALDKVKKIYTGTS